MNKIDKGEIQLYKYYSNLKWEEYKMRTRYKETSMIILMAIALLFSSCATIFNNKQTTISTASGTASEVTIMENGSVIYKGPLPATINVNGSNTYTIEYKDKEGNLRTLQLQKKLSGWFVADILLIGGWIIDLITGDVMEYGKTTILPIKYNNQQQQFLLIDTVPEDIKSKIKVVGNIYK